MGVESNANIAVGGVCFSVTNLPQYTKKGTHTADSCTTGPHIVKGLFRTIVLSKRTDRKIKPNRRSFRKSSSAGGQSSSAKVIWGDLLGVNDTKPNRDTLFQRSN